MLGDPIIIKPEHYQYCEDLMCLMENHKNQDGVVFAIGGPPGAGKTEAAILFQEELCRFRIASLTISVDNYYDTNWRERDYVRKRRGIESVGPSEIRWHSLRHIIKKFRAKESFYYDRINKFSDKSVSIPTCSCFRVLIIEGIYVGILRDVVDEVYLIDKSLDDTYAFRKERGKENPDDPWRKEITKREEWWFLKIKKDCEEFKKNT